MLPLAANLPGAPALASGGDPSPSETTLVFDMLEFVAAPVALKDYFAVLLVNHNSPTECADRPSRSAS
jgi:hypothetical protein